MSNERDAAALERITASDRRLMAAHLTPREAADLLREILGFVASLRASRKKPTSDFVIDTFLARADRVENEARRLRDLARNRAGKRG